MPGLVPGIYVLAATNNVDGRDKPGHDEMGGFSVCRHCEERSDEAIQGPHVPGPLDCFASLAMTE
jgi:hypothetical protein